MPQVYPYASTAKVQEALGVIGASAPGYGDTALKQVWVDIGATAVLSPPTVAPVLTYDPPMLGSFIVDLFWTASNKTSSAGFGYRVYMQYNGGGFNAIETTTNLTTAFNGDPNAGTYDFRIVPFNDAGEGPSSNTASVVLPGEFEAPIGAYLTPDSLFYFVTPDGLFYFQQPDE
jgi:hypothetical protein